LKQKFNAENDSYEKMHLILVHLGDEELSYIMKNATDHL